MCLCSCVCSFVCSINNITHTRQTDSWQTDRSMDAHLQLNNIRNYLFNKMSFADSWVFVWVRNAVNKQWLASSKIHYHWLFLKNSREDVQKKTNFILSEFETLAPLQCPQPTKPEISSLSLLPSAHRTAGKLILTGSKKRPDDLQVICHKMKFLEGRNRTAMSFMLFQPPNDLSWKE